eukprot:TRINITY_DN15781_c0_g2_i3.p1 TRINITY_DN15781_c0_g2~~TRINITY_DN15781_c0_g2_i3.p1  ORF type:complete len:200 (+),score=32.86 TRINITY_DN15781_c0_g2_i3:176-775(+)
MTCVTRFAAFVQIALSMVVSRASDCADGEAMRVSMLQRTADAGKQTLEISEDTKIGKSKNQKAKAIGCGLSPEQVNLVEAFVRGLGDRNVVALSSLFGPDATVVSPVQGEKPAAGIFSNWLPFLMDAKTEVQNIWCEAGGSQAGVVFSFYFSLLSEAGEIVNDGGVYYAATSFVGAVGQRSFAKVVMYVNKFLTPAMLQ